jgi:hypothetical protein
MTALYISMAASGNDEVVRRPRASDAMGAALRGAFGAETSLPKDIVRLLQRLDRP